MGWVRLDDNFADHPKIIALSDSAFRLFITGLCYSNRQLTDGIIPYRMVQAWVGENPMKPSDELEDQDLWARVESGFLILSYAEYQPTRDQVEKKREQVKERLNRYRETQKKRVSNAYQVRSGNANETPPPTQPNPTQPTTLDISNDTSKVVVPLPRVHSALEAVNRLGNKLEEARANGVNAWNLTKLVLDEWDFLHASNDRAGCNQLTGWYVSTLQERALSQAEYARIGQMTTRFGRLSLMAIDEAASKNLQGDDMLNYAFRVAQRMYDETKAKG